LLSVARHRAAVADVTPIWLPCMPRSVFTDYEARDGVVRKAFAGTPKFAAVS
jgi:hypothetical protein